MIASVATSARGLGAAQRNSLHVEERALELSVEDLRARLERMQQLFADALRSRDEVVALLSGAVDRIMAGTDEQLAGFQRREVPRLSAAANRFLAEASDLRAAATSIDAFVAEQVRAAVDPFRREQEQRVGRAFADAASRFVDQIDDLTRRTVRLTGDLLGVRLEEIAPPTEISSVSRFTYQFTEVPTLLESLLPDPKRYLPKGWSRSLALKRVGERIPELVDRHCGRMRGDLLHRLRESRRLLERDLTGRLEATIEGLRRGAERAARDRAQTGPEVRASRDRLAEALGVLDGIDAALDGIVAAAKAGMDGQPAHA